MSIQTNGLPVGLATSYRAAGDGVRPPTGRRGSEPWHRRSVVAREATRTAGLVRSLTVAARTKDARLSALAPTAPVAVGGHAPVVLVHGYAATSDCWAPLTRRLHAEGFDRVHAFSYNAFNGGLPELGRSLADLVTAMMERSGSDTVHLVGHSLGGLLVRIATEWLGLWPQAATVVTIATPHRGCPLAWAAPGRAAWWMRSREWTLPAPVFAGDLSPRYLNFYAARDVVVPRRSARLDQPEVTNIAVAGAGHIGTAQAGALLDTLPDRLAAAEALRPRRPITASSRPLAVPA
jgi:pimeloyl-ACP methyl ester carboxylesterase